MACTRQAPTVLENRPRDRDEWPLKAVSLYDAIELARVATASQGATMFSAGAAVGNVQPYFLTQVEVDLDRWAPLEQQPDLQQITDQALQAADVLTGFIDGATQAAVARTTQVRSLRTRPGNLARSSSVTSSS
jgi:hypothetical protein